MSSSAANWSASRSRRAVDWLVGPPRSLMARPRVQQEMTDLVGDREAQAALARAAAQLDGVAVAARHERRLGAERLAAPLDEREVEVAHDVAQRDGCAGGAGRLEHAFRLVADGLGRVTHGQRTSSVGHGCAARGPVRVRTPPLKHPHATSPAGRRKGRDRRGGGGESPSATRPGPTAGAPRRTPNSPSSDAILDADHGPPQATAVAETPARTSRGVGARRRGGAARPPSPCCPSRPARPAPERRRPSPSTGPARRYGAVAVSAAATDNTATATASRPARRPRAGRRHVDRLVVHRRPHPRLKGRRDGHRHQPARRRRDRRLPAAERHRQRGRRSTLRPPPRRAP